MKVDDNPHQMAHELKETYGKQEAKEILEIAQKELEQMEGE